MKIAFFTDTFMPSINGVTTSIIHFANGLTEAGHHVLIVYPKGAKISRKVRVDFGLNPKIKLLEVKSVPAKIYPDVFIGFPVSKDLILKLNKFNPDVVHTHTAATVGIFGCFYGRFHQKKLFTTFHTYYIDKEFFKVFKHKENIFSRQILKAFKIHLKWFVNLHDTLFVPSQDAYISLQKMKVKPKTLILPNPVNVTYSSQMKLESVQRKKQLAGNSKTILYIGRVSHEKNVLKLLDLLKKVHLHMDVKLIVIGDGPAKADFLQRAMALGVEDKLIFIGSVYHQLLIDEGYYFLGDVFVTFSEFETFGMTTLEAMAHGVPVIAVDSKASSELVKDVGVLIPVNNMSRAASELKKILEDPTRLKMLSKQSLQKASQYDYRSLTEFLIQAYLAPTEI